MGSSRSLPACACRRTRAHLPGSPHFVSTKTISFRHNNDWSTGKIAVRRGYEERKRLRNSFGTASPKYWGKRGVRKEHKAKRTNRIAICYRTPEPTTLPKGFPYTKLQVTDSSRSASEIHGLPKAHGFGTDGEGTHSGKFMRRSRSWKEGNGTPGQQSLLPPLCQTSGAALLRRPTVPPVARA